MAEQESPADGAEDVAEKDAGEADGDFCPVGTGELSAEDGEVEVDSVAAPDEDGGKRDKNDDSENPLLLLKARFLPWWIVSSLNCRWWGLGRGWLEGESLGSDDIDWLSFAGAEARTFPGSFRHD